jgi:chloramphenicol-sensitive protein RarD
VRPTLEDRRQGFFYGLAAYGLWGLMPLYFWLIVERATALEMVACRVGWSFLFLCLVVTALRGWGKVRAAVADRGIMLALSASAVMIAINWIAYVYAVDTSQVLQASLGYFITPLVNVTLGVLILGERLRYFQSIGIALAALGVAILILAGGEVPYISIALALSFGSYGLLRKLAPVDGMSGLLVETAIMGPPAIALFAYLRFQPGVEPYSTSTNLLLASSGIVTAMPLLFFGAAARRLPLTTLGILQYLAPSVQFLFAILLFKEPLTSVKLASFLFIWTAVAVYTYGSLRGMKAADETPEHEPVPEEVLETA